MGGKGSRRRVGPEERRLWERVAASARPLRRALRAETRRTDGPVPDSEPFTEAAGDALAAAVDPARSLPRPAGAAAARGKTALGLGPLEPGPVGRPEPGLDRRTAQRLRRGGRAPDARIDLHGMSAERAHRACLSFLGEAIGRGHRVVLVITGKGRRGDEDTALSVRGRGVLRDSLPGWLRASPLGHSIVGIYQAHRRHGGEGAFYVYLKRHR